VTRATNDVEQVRTFVGTGIIQLAASLVLLVGTVLILGWLNLRLTIAALLTIAPIVWLLASFVRRVDPLFGRVQQIVGSWVAMERKTGLSHEDLLVSRL
jgi:ATP-binding cassette, subfamily B, multidrug efflux pump